MPYLHRPLGFLQCKKDKAVTENASGVLTANLHRNAKGKSPRAMFGSRSSPHPFLRTPWTAQTIGFCYELDPARRLVDCKSGTL